MGLDVNRWLKYAKARLDAAVGSGNKKLDDLEARQEADRADKPWLRGPDDGVAPTLDQVRARIEWEAERQGVDAPSADGGVPDRPQTQSTPDPDPTETAQDETAPADGAPAVAPRSGGSDDPGAGGEEATGGGTDPAPAGASPIGGPASASPQQRSEDAEREMARLELETRQRESAKRLDEIRRELGVDPPPPGDDGGAPTG